MTPDSPAETPDLRERISEALASQLAQEDVTLNDLGLAWLADAVLAVLDTEMERLRTQLDAADTELAEVDTLNQQVENLRAELAEARQAANAAQNLADTWEREHQNTVLPYTTQIEDERDAARAEVASLRAQLARAVVFPEDWQDQIRMRAPLGDVFALIESWRAPEQDQARPEGDDRD